MKKAAEILARILEEKSGKLGTTYSSVFGAWSQIVGESLAEHSRIYEVSNRNLFVEVDHPGWMQLLFMKKSQIIRYVKRKYPALDIRDLKVKVNLRYPSVIREDTESQKKKQKKDKAMSGDKVKEVDRIVSTVRSDELKKSLKRLFLRSIETERNMKGSGRS